MVFRLADMAELNLAEPLSRQAAQQEKLFQSLYKMIVCESLLADIAVPPWVRSAGPQDNERLSRYANNLTRQRLAANGLTDSNSESDRISA